MKILRFVVFTNLCILLCSVISCSPSGSDAVDTAGSNAEQLILEGRSDGVSWSLKLPAAPYAYTDRIPVILSLRNEAADSVRAGDGNKSVTKGRVSLAPAEDTWGDFRVRRLGGSPPIFRGELIPRKTGLCRIAIPVFGDGSVPGGERPADRPLFILEPDLNLQVDSVLSEGDDEAAGLLADEKHSSGKLWIILAVAVIASAGLVVVAGIRKRRSAGAKVSEEQSLNSFLEETMSLAVPAVTVDTYRTIFRLLLRELDGLHPGLRGRGCGPAELRDALEQPSSLNQWNLRSLYPLLGRMEEIFFLPHVEMPDEAEYKEHRKLLAGWLAVLEEEKHEV